MTTDALAAELVRILDPIENGCHIEVLKTLGGCDIVFGKMYDPPSINLHHLNAIGLLFGTDDVTVNGYELAGCETCDFGSDYGHTINVRQVTNHADALRDLAKRRTIYSTK